MSNEKWMKVFLGITAGLSIYGLVKVGRKEKWTVKGVLGSAIIGGSAAPLADPVLRELGTHLGRLPPGTLVQPQGTASNSIVSLPVSGSENAAPSFEEIKEELYHIVVQLPKYSSPSPLDELRWTSILKPGSVVVVIGKRGSGKTATGYLMLEYLRWRSKCFVVGLPKDAHHLLPAHIGVVENLKDAPFDAALLVDEASLLFGSQGSLAEKRKMLVESLVLVRQRGQILIFITQDAGYLDKHTFRAVDTLVIKEPAPLQEKFDRPELASWIKEAQEAFAQREGDTRNTAYVAFSPNGYQGMLQTPTPPFWSEELSRAYAIPSSEKGAKEEESPTRSDLKKEVHRLYEQGLSLRKVASIRGVSKSTVWNLLREDKAAE